LKKALKAKKNDKKVAIENKFRCQIEPVEVSMSIN